MMPRPQSGRGIESDRTDGRAGIYNLSRTRRLISCVPTLPLPVP